MALMTPVTYIAGHDLVNSATSRVRIPRGTIKVEWGPAIGGDTATGVNIASFPDKTVIASGTFGTSAVIVEGSGNSTNGTDGTWVPLNDFSGAPISKTSNGSSVIAENPTWIRPGFGAGSGTALTVILECSTNRG